MTDLRLQVLEAFPDYIREILFSLKKKQAIFPEFEYLAQDGNVWRS
jgi:hypothetical protein